jgi:glycerophosphoryl diester phosphodiesterase
MLHHQVVSAAAVRRAHEAGAAVWAWTVDDPEALARLESAGVDAVISNDPAIFAQGAVSAEANPAPREAP